MDMAMTELPLTIFTTVAPIGAGAFITLAIALFTAKFSDEQLARIDKFTWLPVAVTLIGFVGAFFHLANPLNALNVFAGIGSSPLSNEVAIGVVFVLVALIYAVLASLGKLCCKGRKIFCAVVAVVAVVFAVFTGLAYAIDTIPAWAPPAASISIVGFALLGGGLLAGLQLALSGSLEEALGGGFKIAALAIIIAGVVLGITGMFMQTGAASAVVTAVADGSAMAAAVSGYQYVAAALLVCAAVLGAVALLKKPSATMMGIALIVAVSGTFIARLVFYALQVGVGL